MTGQLRPAAFILLLLTLITGVIYPLIVTGLAQLVFADQANGSLVDADGLTVGSALLGQANDDPRYFWPRPSATAYDTLPSGSSNLAPTSLVLAEQVSQRLDAFRDANDLPADVPVPVEMLFASGSGLDPHISPDAARLQAGRVAQARGLSETQVLEVLTDHIEDPQLGFLGKPRVNVLLLNLALDQLQ